MTIHFHCDCGQKLKASADSVGKNFDCPVCGTTVVVPEQDEATRPARKPVAVPAAAATAQQTTDEPKSSTDTQSRAAERPSRPAAKQNEEHQKSQASKAGKNGAAKRKSKRPSDEDVALEALGLIGDGPSETETREIAESDTKIIDGSDTSELDRPGEEPTEVRNGYIPESETRLRSDDEILADRVRTMAHNQQVHPDAIDQEASTADTARDLYKLVRKMKKSDQPAEPVKKKRKKRGEDGEPFDYAGFASEMLRTVVPGLAGVCVVAGLAYWISSSVMSGGRGLPELGDVSGVVTLDGKPLAGANVMFIPQVEDEEAASHIAPSSGTTDADGSYSLMYVKDVEGAAVGPHIVTISAPKPNGAESLPLKYNSASELKFEVKPGSNDAPFELMSE